MRASVYKNIRNNVTRAFWFDNHECNSRSTMRVDKQFQSSARTGFDRLRDAGLGVWAYRFVERFEYRRGAGHQFGCEFAQGALMFVHGMSL